MAIGFSSSPQNSRDVVGQIVFVGWNDKSGSLERPSTQCIALLASHIGIDSLNMGNRSSRYHQREMVRCLSVLSFGEQVEYVRG